MSSPDSTGTPNTYDEQIVVSRLHELYTLLLQLSYFDRSQVVFPPRTGGGHPINEALCHELGLAPAVISLMKNIPYVVEGYHKPILWQSRAFEYLHDQELRNGRDPERTDTGRDDELRMDFLRPYEVALTCWLDDGVSIILNTRDNTIQIIDEAEPVDDFRTETDTHHAPAYLQKIVDDVRNLDVVYFPERDSDRIALAGWEEQVRIKQALTEEFGWGSPDFREGDWRVEGPGICERIADEALERETERQRNAPRANYVFPE